MSAPHHLFPIAPDWGTPVKDTYEFLTDIFVSASGKEQRRAMRRHPRRRLQFDAVLDEAIIAAFRHLRRTAREAPFEVCDFVSPPAHLLAAAPVGSTVVLAETPHGFPLVPGRLALHDGWNIEHVTLSSVVPVSGFDGGYDEGFDGTRWQLTFAAPLARAWMADTALHAVGTARLQSGDVIEMLTPSAARSSVTALFVAGSSAGPWLPSDFPVLDGYEIFDHQPDWSREVGFEVLVPFEEVDYDIGVTAAVREIDFNSHLLECQHVGLSHREARRILSFFIRQEGRRGEFWAPSWGSDLIPASGLLEGSTKLLVHGAGAADFDDAVHRALTVIDMDGALMHLPIESIEAGASFSPGDFPAGFTSGFDAGFDGPSGAAPWSLITFSEPIPATLTRDRIDRICWLHRARFATDDLTVEWLTGTVAKILVNLQTLEAL